MGQCLPAKEMVAVATALRREVTQNQVAAADRRICVGNMEFHYFAGYSEDVFEQWMLNSQSPDAMIERIGRDFRLGGHQCDFYASWRLCAASGREIKNMRRMVYSGVYSLAAVALTSMMALLLTGCMEAKEAIGYFANTNMIMSADWIMTIFPIL